MRGNTAAAPHEKGQHSCHNDYAADTACNGAGRVSLSGFLCAKVRGLFGGASRRDGLQHDLGRRERKGVGGEREEKKMKVIAGQK